MLNMLKIESSCDCGGGRGPDNPPMFDYSCFVSNFRDSIAFEDSLDVGYKREITYFLLHYSNEG